VKPAMVLLVALALLGNGCTSLSPSAASKPNLEQEAQDSHKRPRTQGDEVMDEILYYAYWPLYFCGQFFSGK
jgi:hypothetical protein